MVVAETSGTFIGQYYNLWKIHNLHAELTGQIRTFIQISLTQIRRLVIRATSFVPFAASMLVAKRTTVPWFKGFKSNLDMSGRIEGAGLYELWL
jgi:hypothetical protein